MFTKYVLLKNIDKNKKSAHKKKLYFEFSFKKKKKNKLNEKPAK